MTRRRPGWRSKTSPWTSHHTARRESQPPPSYTWMLTPPGPGVVDRLTATRVGVERHVVRDARGPERVPVGFVVEDRVGPSGRREVHAVEPARRGPLHFLHREVDVPDRDVREPEQALRIDRHEVGEPLVVEVVADGGELEIAGVVGETAGSLHHERERLAVHAEVVEHLARDAVAVHVAQARRRRRGGRAIRGWGGRASLRPCPTRRSARRSRRTARGTAAGSRAAAVRSGGARRASRTRRRRRACSASTAGTLAHVHDPLDLARSCARLTRTASRPGRVRASSPSASSMSSRPKTSPRRWRTSIAPLLMRSTAFAIESAV